MEMLGRYVPKDSPPREQAKFRYRYSLTDFAAPENPTDLHLDKSFYQRRKMKEQVTVS